MDPNATLLEMRELRARMLKAYYAADSNGIDQDDAARLAELCEALDTWICDRDALPREWRDAQP